MGRTIPLVIARAASIVLAGMLLFAIFAHAHAENLDGYGIKPLGGPETGDYGLKPVPGDAPNAGFNAAPAGAAPQPAPLPMAYAPAASSEPYGYRPAPAAAAPAQPMMPAAQPMMPAAQPVMHPQPQP